MKRRSFRGSSVVLAIAAFSGCHQKTTAIGPSGIEWRTDHDEALAEAKAAGKPVLVNFWADWCGPCKELDADMADPEIKALLGRFMLIRVDMSIVEVRAVGNELKKTPRNPTVRRLVEQYKVDGIPDVRILSGSGQQVEALEGPSKEELKAALRKASGG